MSRLNRDCSYSLIPNVSNAGNSHERNVRDNHMGQKWDKFCLLLWKNWVLQYRKPLQTLIEIIAPVLFSILLVLIRRLVSPEPHDAIEYNPFCTIPFDIPGFCETPAGPNITYIRKVKKILGTSLMGGNDTDYSNIFNTYTLVYSPHNEAIDAIMSLFIPFFNQVESFNNSADMVDYYITSGRNNTFAAIQFQDSLINRTDLGPDENVDISIRFPAELRFSRSLLEQNNWHTNLIYPLFQTAGPRSPNSTSGATPNYFTEGFITLQHLLSTLVTLYKAGYNISGNLDISDLLQLRSLGYPFVNMRRFPYAAWKEDLLLTPLKSFVSIIIMLSFVYPCINTVKSITAEKEKQLKEAMKIMGLPSWLHWVAWFLKSFSYLLVSIILMIVLLKVRWYTNSEYTVFTYANPLVLFIFLLFYVCSTITFCFAISVFFSKANTAATIAGVMWFLSYAPFSFLQNNYDTLSLGTKLSSSIGANTAMAFGFQIVLMYEGTGEGVQFDNIWKPNTPDDDLSLGIVMTMLLLDSIIYLLIALYVETVFPGSYGVPKKWYFPFTSEFWCGQPRNSGIEDFDDTVTNNNEFFEVEPKNLQIGIRIKKLKRVFGKKLAVRNLSLNMYEDQITVLLGHNGAGKTTTMSMLTGMITPSSGTAVVNGYDIRSNMEGVRNSLGLCPQHNIIFDDLTVAEHIYFFSRLKGLKGQEIGAEITKYVNLLELQDKINSKSSTLSGGMKRRLCVGIALCGNSKVVMLDEPTAGMDPTARRALWDLLLKQKAGRTLLLTTHFMDEADLLGDRIAIMARGELQCCGSSFFLKKKYGAGYHLILDKSPQCDPEKVTMLFRKYIADIEVHSSVGSELTYLLAESQSYIFETMLRDLEQQCTYLGINSYGISLTTLEDVFMKVGADHVHEETYNATLNNEMNGNSTMVDNKVSDGSSPRITASTELLLNQISAMTLKKIFSIIRSWILLVIQVLIPVIFLIITMIVVRMQNRIGNLPAMPLELSRFKDPVALVDGMEHSGGFADFYKSVAGSAFNNVSSIKDTILTLTAKTPVTVRRRYIGGASFTPFSGPFFDVNYTVYFNNDPYHTPALALNLALNSIYRKIVGCNDCGIRITNYPLPYSADTQISLLATVGNNMGFQLAFNICFSMAFVSSFYILFVIRERVSQTKHLQFVSGVKVHAFWLTNLFWDYTTYLATIAALMITLICFQEDGFKTFSDIGRLFLIFLYFGWCMLPMIYLSGFLFDIPSTGFTRMTFFSIFTGCAAFLVVQLLGTPGFDLEHVGNTLHWIFLTVPHYSLASGIFDTYKLFSYNKLCNTYYETCKQQYPNFTKDQCWDLSAAVREVCKGLDDHYFKWQSPGIGRNLLFSFTVGFVLLLLLLAIDYKIFSQITYQIEQKYFPKYPSDIQNVDSDVLAEKHNIWNTPENELNRDYSMYTKDLTKYYKNFLAVNGISLGVRRYECFGLLGINGAGKTTTFKMLTGDIKISYGDAWVNGNSIKSSSKEVQRYIGYCPQFDALLDDLTARETLTMFCLLRGIPRSFCDMIALKLATDFDYRRHLDKKVRELSGGNKRKLSTSVALIGDPPVVYLDEPSTGMDPATKRFLWNVLCHVRDSGKTIILTTHSMEECEALCTRIAIMVNGNFKCLGSTQHLKSKFAEGYTLIVKVKKTTEIFSDASSASEQIEQFIRDKFPSAVLREKHEELLTYYITDKSVPWSKMFGILERAKKGELSIEDYSLGQSSLEQVFLTFTKHQHQSD
ncbi:phospholipid-transporting ATPase ABCA3-like isoform X1 [Euwallacea fornicatus]|uniref:phospholipid-transporting ATPase ABCA3-like isoform X1 n=3 Tax=Euwallacea fornicatus TaxID=995702 RepID=UPI00338E7102